MAIAVAWAEAKPPRTKVRIVLNQNQILDSAVDEKLISSNSSEDVLGLAPEDIDTNSMTIHIRRAVTHPNRNQPEAFLGGRGGCGQALRWIVGVQLERLQAGSPCAAMVSSSTRGQKVGSPVGKVPGFQ